MKGKSKILTISSLVVFAIIAVALIMPLGLAAPKAPKAPKACSDGFDNDGDGYTDWPDDPGCSKNKDKSELNPNIECDDGSDNDGDSAIDYNDTGCSSPTDNDETNCGDDVCEGGETPVSCPEDCGIPDSCSDTDGGLNTWTFGTTSGSFNETNYSSDDYCVDSSDVMEYYCNGDYEQSTQASCGTDYYNDSYCIGDSVYKDLTDYFCSSGECDVSVTPVLQENCTGPEICVSGECIIPDSCSDTDGGFVVGTQGTVSGYFFEESYSDTDFCVDNTTITEYYCGGDYAYNWTGSCVTNTTSSCTSGACI